MDRNIFRYILRHSLRAQIAILAMTLASFPFLYATLELPKLIINDALANANPHRVLGFTFDQIDYLFLLCGLFLALVLVNGAFKYVINVYQGIVGERMLRRLRYELYSRIMRFPLPRFRRVSTGETVQMINAEVEPLGGFIGSAFALPAFQGGTLLTVLAFMFAQNPIMGLAAIVLYPLQIYWIPKLQAQVNALGKLRVRQVRRLADRIAETVGGVRDIRANDTTQHERSRFSRELGVVFDIRFQIYKKKFFIKFINNFLAQLGPFFFYSIGGYLVIRGQLTLGALVAVLGAHKELYSPWKELLSHYQLTWDSQIKYEQVVAQFDPTGLRDEGLQISDPAEAVALTGDLRASNVTLVSEDGQVILDGASFALELPAHLAILGPAGSGKEELTLVLANLLEPDAGRVLINGVEVNKLPEAITGRQITFVGYPAHIFAGTILDNLLLGLRHRPLRPREREGAAAEVFRRNQLEAELSGNSPFDSEADWIDYEAAGLSGPEEVVPAAVRALAMVRLERDVYHMGLRGTIDPDAQPEVAAAILQARRAMRRRLEDGRYSRLVEVFDLERYNTNATLAENLLFGAPVDETFAIDHLAAHPYVRQTLERAGLSDTLAGVGLKLAATMVELFVDLPPDHEYFRQFSFINADDLPEYRALTSRADPEQARRAQPRGPRAPDRADLQAGAGAPSAGLDRRGRAGADPRGAPAVPRASAARVRRQRGVLRPGAVHRRRQHPGQHPVRQGRLRPSAGDRAHRRADQRGPERARLARSRGRGRAADPDRGRRRPPVARATPEAGARPRAPQAPRGPDPVRGHQLPRPRGAAGDPRCAARGVCRADPDLGRFSRRLGGQVRPRADHAQRPRGRAGALRRAQARRQRLAARDDRGRITLSQEVHP